MGGVKHDVIRPAIAGLAGVGIVAAIAIGIFVTIAIGGIELAVAVIVGHELFRITDGREIEIAFLRHGDRRIGRDIVDLFLDQVLDLLFDGAARHVDDGEFDRRGTRGIVERALHG